MDMLRVKRALLSVTDKSGLADFARFLSLGGVELVSTGGTLKALADAGLEVTPVSRVTGFPEMLGGRVKTLHPHIHAGILADKDNPEHLLSLGQFELAPFDLICVNLYAFDQAAKQGLALRHAIEQIDIGGPTMLRAAAKNFHSVLVVPDAGDYPGVREELEANSYCVCLETRRKLAAKTFGLVSRYDAMIADYISAHGA